MFKKCINIDYIFCCNGYERKLLYGRYYENRYFSIFHKDYKNMGL